MDLKTYLFKPRWHNKDPQLRAEAIAHGSEPELLAALPGLALDDEDAGVRMAAARRLRDLPTLLLAAGRGRGPEEQRVLEDRIRTLAGSGGSDRPPLQLRLELARTSPDRALLEQFARHAPEAELRLAAVGRLEQQGLLGDIAIHDADPAVRQAAAARIHQHSTLLRVIEACRRSDKLLHDSLGERLRRERLAAGDPVAVAEEAQRICAELEQLVLQPPADLAARRSALETQWQAIADLAPAALRQRFDNDLRRLDAPPPDPVVEGPAEPVVAAADPEPAPETTTAAEVPAPEEVPPEPQAAEPGEPAPEPPASRDARPEFPAELEARFEVLRNHLDAGELAPALETRAALLEAAKPFAGHPRWRRLQGRLGRMDGRLRELRDWQHWSNNTVRKELIAEVEALPGSGLHPDAVLEKLKQAQAKWKELEASEQLPDQPPHPAAPGLWRRFQAAGRAAFSATKPFLDKRSELQQRRLEESRAIAEEIRALAGAETADWTALRQAVSRGAQALRALGELPPRQRQKVGARLKKALDAANARTREYEGELEKAKRALIRQASQLAQMPARAEAIAAAKALQAQWTAAGNLRRGEEQKLWLEFRGHIDPLFADQQAEQDARRAERAGARTAQQALVTSLQQLLDDSATDIEAQRGRVQGLEDAWRELADPDPRMRQQFQALLGRYRDLRRGQRRAVAQAERERLWHKAALLQAVERPGAAGEPAEAEQARLHQEWPATPVSPGATERALDARREQALAAPGRGVWDATTVDIARRLAIQLEFLAGLSSPPGERELRMHYQVDRLAQTLAGDRPGESAHDEARRAEHEWLLLGPMPAAEHAAFETRVKAALKEVYREQ